MTTDPIAAAAQRYHALQAAADQARAHLFDACADRVRARLDTAESLAPRAGVTAVTIRKELRRRGVGPLPPGRPTGTSTRRSTSPLPVAEEAEARSGLTPP